MSERWSGDAQTWRGLPPAGRISGDAWMTIGSFDGVHRGHQHLLHRLSAGAARAGAAAVVVTFDPHPRCVVDPGRCPALLTTLDERVRLLSRSGVQHVVIMPFTDELAAWSAERFCAALLETINVRRIAVGPGFALGRGRSGDASFLRDYGASHGFDVEIVAPAMRGGAVVSSTRVRSALREGRIAEARNLLGRHYALSGSVVSGERRGRVLGFPTANLSVDTARSIPAHGVYASWARIANKQYAAATSIGIRPTFGSSTETIETHLLDFDGDLYGEDLEVAFVRRLRGERRFAGAPQLVEQMRRDVAATRRTLTASPSRWAAV